MRHGLVAQFRGPLRQQFGGVDAVFISPTRSWM
jgi:hypothetical protein